MSTTETRTRLKAAKAKLRSIQEGRQADRLERASQLMESCGDGWVGGIYAMLDRFNSWQQDFGGATFAGLGYGGGMATTINDRRFGKNFPIYQTEQDLQLLRLPSRLLLATNGYAQGMLEGLTSYVCGDGFTQEVRAKPGREDQVPQAILDKLNGVLDDFRIRNDWHGGEVPGLEEELFQRGEEDGEYFLHLYEDDDGCTWVSTVEPEQVTAPTGADINYLFGIRTDSHNPQCPQEYWIRGWNTALEGESYAAAEVVHFRNNVKRQMKRGIPSFSFGVADTFALADRLRRALGVGAGVQAGIAGVRQWDNATASQVSDFASSFADYTSTNPMTGAAVPVKRYEPGGIEDIPKGMTWVNPPNASNAPAHVQILQACLRGGTARWNAPEWIGSGDASNNNFASALVADAPFTKRIIRTQKRHEGVQRRVFAWVLETRCKRQGVIAATQPDGTVVSIPWDELRRLVEVVVTAPSVEVRNKIEEAQANQIRIQGGWKSRQTVQAEEGLDAEREQANIDEWNAKNGPAQPDLPLPGDPKGGDGELQGGGSGKLKESRKATKKGRSLLESKLVRRLVRELADWDENKHKRAGDGKFGSGSGGGSSKSKADDKPASKEKPSSGHAAAKLTAGVDKLGEEVAADPEAKAKGQSTLAKVGSALKGLALGEFPAWALDTCDLWIFEDIIGKAGSQAGVPGVVLMTKAAAWGAAKAYLAIRGAKKVQESEAGESEPDVLTTARKLHAVMQAVADGAGVEPPSIEEVVDRLHKAKA